MFVKLACLSKEHSINFFKTEISEMYNLGNYQTNVKKINETNIGKYIQEALTDVKMIIVCLTSFLTFFPNKRLQIPRG